jgi:3-oxocholest-4-en-26-oate---CoA ligase
VLWRQSDTYVSSMVGADHASATEIHDKVRRNEGAPWFAVSPLMHAAGLWTVFSGALAGLPVVLYDDRAKFDPASVLRTAAREKVGLMTMVGDAYAAPLIEELQRTDYDLASLYAIGTGGAATNPKHVAAILEKLPQVTIINGYGSSETGNMGFGHNQRGSHRETFDLREGGTVVSDDLARFVEPGEPEVGWVVRTGRIPLGYFDDEAATGTTFPVVEGRRVVVSGDRASLEADGTLRLFGRDSLVINTGGEKVFVEEVEAVLRAHPGVADALVVGRPSERWGQEVVALVERRPDATVAPGELHADCVEHLARFKAPKEFLFVEKVRRLGNGKADYRWAKAEALAVSR